jgi:dolichyl-phosphate beta-glucosyltransferase
VIISQGTRSVPFHHTTDLRNLCSARPSRLGSGPPRHGCSPLSPGQPSDGMALAVSLPMGPAVRPLRQAAPSSRRRHRMNANTPDLSIVIPAYNEERRLSHALARIRDYFYARRADVSGIEIIVVDDGSTDKTATVAKEWAGKMPCVRLLSNGENRGKGYSVRHGMAEARGRIALFTDADLSAPIPESEKLFAAIEAGHDVAIGSRAIDRSLIVAHQSRFREVAGIIFNGFVRLFTGLPFQDTQCGFKAFVRERCRIIFEQQRIERFGFDPELLFLAQRHGLRIAEVPVRWAHDPATRIHVLRDSLWMFGELICIRWNWLLGRYPRCSM